MGVRPIEDVGAELGLGPALVPYGRHMAKVDPAALGLAPRGKGRLVLVSSINPTPSGEGKTTMSIALAMGLRQLGENAIAALRQPALGPVFGIKGGGTGGGKASLFPEEEINLHFTGDTHAVTTAHNLLSALVDNACHFRTSVPVMGPAAGTKGEIDPHTIRWGRAIDMDDRFLRHVVIGLGGSAHGSPREEHFDISAASEVMAILALSESHQELQRRLGRIVVAATKDGAPVTAEDVGASAAMTAVLRDALLPNLVQTLEGGPAFVHAGPFANIAHGTSSVVATELAMRLGDWAITEGGFGFDLGGEKFLDIKCRQLGVWPRVCVLVVTLRALRWHGGASRDQAALPSLQRLRQGLVNLERHAHAAKFFGLPVVVAINHFDGDPEEELREVETAAAALGAKAARCEGFARGGAGALALAEKVREIGRETDASPPRPRFVYDEGDSPRDKMRKIARTMYGANDVELTPRAERDLEAAVAYGGEGLPICMAKTPLSLSDDPTRHGAPSGFSITVREVRLAAGAGFLVALTGDVNTMPGLPSHPAAWHIRLAEDGRVRGLMQEED
ncbi:MAG TPA: formate--tetrahydrofolate ligase [Polyangiaceae bacterium]|nr:formate--tetrahydrofolate ligase [Polyangiaceae bacterium]